jgi:putative acetyltransferase
MATRSDLDAIRGVHLSAFPEAEREMVARLAIDLLCEESNPPIVSLVAETDGAVVAHGAFSPVSIEHSEALNGYILAPLGVRPAFQGRGIGSRLVRSGLQRLTRSGAHILFVYGDPGYYGRFGFGAEPADRYIPPYRLQYPFGWQSIALNGFNSEGTSRNLRCVDSLCDPALW